MRHGIAVRLPRILRTPLCLKTERCFHLQAAGGYVNILLSVRFRAHQIGREGMKQTNEEIINLMVKDV